MLHGHSDSFSNTCDCRNSCGKEHGERQKAGKIPAVRWKLQKLRQELPLSSFENILYAKRESC